MRSLIGQRNNIIPRARPKSVIEPSNSQGSVTSSGSGSVSIPDVQYVLKALEEATTSAERDIIRVGSSHESLQNDLSRFVSKHNNVGH